MKRDAKFRVKIFTKEDDEIVKIEVFQKRI